MSLDASVSTALVLASAEAQGASPVAPDDPARFFNRELSWLEFNQRVLESAQNPDHPLMERLRFLAISGSNLDEFYTVRVAALRGLLRRGVSTRSVDGRAPSEQLAQVDRRCRELMEAQQRSWTSLRAELEAAGVSVVGAEGISPEDLAWARERFMSDIFPVLTPLAVDPAHPFPFVANKGFGFMLDLKRKAGGASMRALLLIPSQLRRFLRMPDAPGVEGLSPRPLRFMPIDTIIDLNLDRVFPGYEAQAEGAFRILRDSDMEVEEEAEDLVREFETALKRRRRGGVIRLTVTAETPDYLREMLAKEMMVGAEEMIVVDRMIGVADLSQLISDDRPDLLWRPYTPRAPERVRDHHGDIFAAIRQKDMLVHHPYETFDVVVNFVRQAAEDPDVVSIKQTLYRTSHQSPIVDALCAASEAGKSVTALVELKARFDEAANIRQARRLERAGVQVVYGFMDWKTHAKISMVVRREPQGMAYYTHFGTGNYHPITARIYTDLSFFTCDPAFGRDAAQIFNYITGYAQPEALEALAFAPLTLKSTMLEEIRAEAAHAREGRPGRIWAKLNAVTEPEIIDALYEASQAGVKIDLVVRGICALRPGIPGLSENIRVKSVVGRFLEHARIICFGNGYKLPSKSSKVYISSADWMERNLNRRIETLVPILNQTVRDQILLQVMAANLRDVANSWILRPDGSYVKAESSGEGAPFNCHEFFLNNPSLSGRGRAGIKDAPRLEAARD
ncbi:RNA degradosome polyphosphate kinase [Neomegalonema sp.]|uniref:RNA degradosome polyphosphate kinase n=1 Tax=Neomegalonema sp. TaxID=2039713 RepID=UPI00260642A8|nr:RNA degradosome polyphosphate kinase [Neomegalonema sp.]MDD2869523.1 RNA degradosome polyphosphate kinase [Neomegalonema sp.]